MRWAVSLDDLPVDKLFDETSDRAEHILDVVKPQTGKYPVIIDADVLLALFNAVAAHLTSRNAYHSLPFSKPGESFIPDARGDLITLSLDPTLQYGADTTAVSEQGLLQPPCKLVDGNRIIATATDKRYADYLGVPTTTVRGDIVIEPGKLSHEELTRHAPQVIEILQFSGLFVDGNNGTFSSEIRLAKLYDNVTKKVTYLKGGSLSGSIKENFKDARFSRQRMRLAHFSANNPQGEGYFGPEHVLLSDVSIVG
jgi:predicted Zn-dependent protease